MFFLAQPHLDSNVVLQGDVRNLDIVKRPAQKHTRAGGARQLDAPYLVMDATSGVSGPGVGHSANTARGAQLSTPPRCAFAARPT